MLAIGTHPGKTPLFSVDDRLAMLQETCAPDRAQRRLRAALHHICRSRRHDGAARRRHACSFGDCASATDFDYEMEMAGMNGAMAPDVQTVFLPAAPAVRPITATLVRQIASMGGDVTPFVPHRSQAA